MEPYATAAMTRQKENYPSPPPTISTLDGCVSVMSDQISRLHAIVEQARNHADRLVGQTEKVTGERPGGPQPVPNGYLDAIGMYLRNTDALLNELYAHHGRISRALSEG